MASENTSLLMRAWVSLLIPPPVDEMIDDQARQITRDRIDPAHVSAGKEDSELRLRAPFNRTINFLRLLKPRHGHGVLGKIAKNEDETSGSTVSCSVRGGANRSRSVVRYDTRQCSMLCESQKGGKNMHNIDRRSPSTSSARGTTVFF